MSHGFSRINADALKEGTKFPAAPEQPRSGGMGKPGTEVPGKHSNKERVP